MKPSGDSVRPRRLRSIAERYPNYAASSMSSIIVLATLPSSSYTRTFRKKGRSAEANQGPDGRDESLVP